MANNANGDRGYLIIVSGETDSATCRNYVQACKQLANEYGVKIEVDEPEPDESAETD